MEIIPAIDIRGGRCVRLTQGDFERETVFAEDPAAVARRWQDAGAQRLHVVDLDGARQGRPLNAAAIQRVLAAVFLPVQLGGGLRELTMVQQYLEMGADRVVLGTAALKDKPFLKEALARYGERIVVAVDARDGIVVAEGWREVMPVRAEDLIRELAGLGVRRIVYTDVLRDGTLTEPNFPAIESLLQALATAPSASNLQPPTSIIYSGGIASIDHLRRLAGLGLEGAIVGKALYTGAIDLTAALAAVMAR